MTVLLAVTINSDDDDDDVVLLLRVELLVLLLLELVVDPDAMIVARTWRMAFFFGRFEFP